ncbi:hypothetical protein ABIC88_003876 [Pseudomonas kilonensis]
MVGPRFSCGSGLAREAEGQFSVMVDVRAPSRASSLPQVILGVHESGVHRRPTVGAGLLAKRRVSFGDGGCAGPIASKLAPTGDLGCSRILCSPQADCGSGLAREAEGQFSVMVDVRAPSRASPLPQVILGVHESGVHRRPTVGASLLAMAVFQPHGYWAAGPIASRLAPTGETRSHQEPGRLSGRLTASGRYRSNGYTHQKNDASLSGKSKPRKQHYNAPGTFSATRCDCFMWRNQVMRFLGIL